MLSLPLRRPLYFNQDIRSYCLQSTNNYVKKLIDKRDEERKYGNINLNLVTNEVSNNPNTNNPIFPLFFFLSLSSFVYYFLKCRK
jgi:hypothetical protein